jgi:endoglucanase
VNVSDFCPTDADKRFGKKLSEKFGGKRFVIGPSRNGTGSLHGGRPGGELAQPTRPRAGEPPGHEDRRSARRRLSVGQAARRVRRRLRERPQGGRLVAECALEPARNTE